MKISVVIAAYNEAENVKNLTERLIRTLDAAAPGKWELIYVIEGVDGTYSLAQEFASARPEIRVLYNEKPSGLGAAFRRGFAEISSSADLVATMDADLNHQPEEIPALMQALQSHSADIVVGSRKAAGGTAEGTPAWKRFLSNTGNQAMRRVMRVPALDQTSGFRVYRRAALQAISFDNDGFAFLPEILIRAHAKGFRIVEVPIRFTYRIHGKSKMKIVPTALSYASLFLKARKQPGGKLNLGHEMDDRSRWDQHWVGLGESGKRSMFGWGAGIVRRIIFQPAVNHFLEKHFPHQGTFCEMGCGTGESSMQLPARKRRFIGLDFSAQALTQAQTGGAFHELLCGDIVRLPLRSESLDGIWNLGVMEHFPRPMLVQILQEFRRTLRPGGVAILFWPAERNSSRWVLAPVEWAKSTVSGQSFHFFPDEVSRLKSKAEAAAILQEAGLKPVEIKFALRTWLIHTVVVARKEAQTAAA